MYKKVNLVMLPTNEKAINSGIYKYSEICSGSEQFGWWNELRFTKSEEKMGDFSWNIKKAQHLYILSDEEIKEGDWVYSILYGIGHVEKDYGNSLRPLTVKFDNSEVRQSYHRNGFYDNLDVATHNCKKIIATTDKSLIIPYDGKTPISENWEGYKLPQPSQSFIEKFVEEYNKGNVITEVMVEYNDWFANGYDGKIIPTSLKINPKDNTINIKPIKDSWNKYEHVANLIKYRNDYETFKQNCHYGPNQKEIKEWTDKWIEQNL